MYENHLFGGVLLLIFTIIIKISRHWCRGPLTSLSNKKKLHGKVIVITGATSGIGLEALRDLSCRGPRILMLCRDMKAGEKISREIGPNVEPFECDVSSLASVQSCADLICGLVDNIDILINNAGIMACDRRLTPEGYDLQLATNHLGHFLLTEALLFKMKRPGSKILITASFCHIYGKINWSDINFAKAYSPMKAYGQSKLGNVLHGIELSKRLPGNIRVYVVNPGVVDTNISRFSWILRLCFLLGKPWIKSPLHGAQTLIHCCLLSEEGGRESLESIYFSDCQCKAIKNLVQYNKESKRFWDLSERLIDDAIKKE